ncbi:hypothetical protein SUGI_0133380 [Cryptomeria japonica]|nr:hypothetical protein SUGI_0133380 [Cryptomeria japonica]
MASSTIVNINHAFPEVETLTLRAHVPLHPHALSSGCTQIDGRYSRMTIASILERMSAKQEIIETTIVTLLRFINIKDDIFYYTACPLTVNGKECKKKCTQVSDVSWVCPRCQVSVSKCNYKYLLPMKLQDAIGTLWAIAFDEVGADLIKKTAKDLYMLQYDMATTQTPRFVINIVVSDTYAFTLLISTDTYNSEHKLKVVINKVCKLDYEAECVSLLAEIARLSARP